ncbi:PAS domain S-box protein [Mucilaginibacter sp. ZT4R22]|uniref:histidine kinase n=1 Tax=Mucilaginibacter pankratovii TaxID=2772110 RepID=A0ABR7WQS4_9SPHI|nr:PAS domain-containing sensor histidine kinase [Mucilaginibacter pankratovii]MBD1364674.1 PAS domain S-box protein [Mucilaginibacter pankratovii]
MENIYKIILEETLAGYWDYQVKENTVVLSPAFKAIFGYQDHELANSTDTWAKLIVEEDRPRMDKCVTEHYLSHGLKPYNIDVRYKHKNGSIVWVNTTGRVIEWDGDEPVRMVGCHLDISKKKKTELSLEISEETFRNAFEHSSIGMVLVSTEGKFLKVNKSICAMLGYTAEELITKTFQEITHPDDLEADLSLLQKTLNKEIKNYQMEKRYFTKSGKVIWIVLNVSLVRDEEEEPLYFVSQIKDITERKKAEEALRESERRWAFASEGSGGGLWDWDIKNRTIFHSEQCLRMIGMENDNFGAVLGDWTSRVHPADKGKYLADLKKHLRGETEIYTNQHRVLCKDNTYKWILDRGKIMEYDENDKPLRVIGTHTDITEQKNKEEQLRESLDMVSGQNNRLLNFAYIVSHNLRTHASNFKMIMDVLSDPQTNDEEKAELSGHLINVSQQLNDTITNLNEVVSIQTNIDIHTIELNLHSYVEKAIELLSNDIAIWNVEINNRIPKDRTLIYSPAYLESIMLNLLSNGIKYRSLTSAPRITIEYFEEQNGGHGFIVADNGIGIDLKKHGEELFGMYKTFHGNRDAKGMGLFITKNQVESFGGKIEVSSELGKGTTFKVYLA